MTGRRLCIILSIVCFWWYGIWCFFHHVMGFNVIQSWLGLLAVLVVLRVMVARDIREADNNPLQPPSDWGLPSL